MGPGTMLTELVSILKLCFLKEETLAGFLIGCSAIFLPGAWKYKWTLNYPELPLPWEDFVSCSPKKSIFQVPVLLAAFFILLAKQKTLWTLYSIYDLNASTKLQILVFYPVYHGSGAVDATFISNKS